MNKQLFYGDADGIWTSVHISSMTSFFIITLLIFWRSIYCSLNPHMLKPANAWTRICLNLHVLKPVCAGKLTKTFCTNILLRGIFWHWHPLFHMLPQSYNYLFAWCVVVFGINVSYNWRILRQTTPVSFNPRWAMHSEEEEVFPAAKGTVVF